MNICNRRVDCQRGGKKTAENKYVFWGGSEGGGGGGVGGYLSVCVCVCQSDAGEDGGVVREGEEGALPGESRHTQDIFPQTPGDQRSNFPHLPLRELINKILITSRLILRMEPQPEA